MMLALRIYGRGACCARTKVVVRGCELRVSGCGGRGRKICGFAAGKGGLVRICAHEGGCACLCARLLQVGTAPQDNGSRNHVVEVALERAEGVLDIRGAAKVLDCVCDRVVVLQFEQVG